jgi:hypothetical protein
VLYSPYSPVKTADCPYCGTTVSLTTKSTTPTKKGQISEQAKFDNALITMPLCLASSAYRGNPFYNDFKTLMEFGKKQISLFNQDNDAFITNTLDHKAVEDWLKSCGM